MNTAEIKTYLLNRLLQEHAFWSYDKDSVADISDWNLIKFVLIHLDLADINLLFEIYSKRQIKKVWLKELVRQGDFLRNMNLAFALLYFDIKEPVSYLKRMETYYLNREIMNEKVQTAYQAK